MGMAPRRRREAGTFAIFATLRFYTRRAEASADGGSVNGPGLASVD
jgi:hypothetical protein